MKKKNQDDSGEKKIPKQNINEETDLFEQDDFDNDLVEERGYRLLKSKRRIKKIRIAATVMAIVVTFSTLAYLNTRDPLGLIEWTKNFTAGIGPGDAFPQASPSGAITDMVAVRDGIVLLTDTSVVKYKNNGKIIYNHPHHYKKPVMQVSSTRVFVYDLNGYSYSIYDNAGLLKEGKTDSAILSASISDNGYYCIVTKSNDFTCSVTVYDEKNNEQYIWDLKDEYAVDTAVNNDGESFAISTIKAKDNKYISTVYIYDMNKKDPIAINVYEDTMIMDIYYTNNDANIIAIGDKLTSKTSAYGWDRVDYSYEGKFLKNYTVNENNLTLLLSNYVDDGNELAVVLDENCTEIVQIVPDGIAKGICADDQNIFILYDDKLLSYDFTGAVIEEWKSNVEDYKICANNRYVYKSSRVTISSFK